jgi:hypothetical protein
VYPRLRHSLHLRKARCIVVYEPGGKKIALRLFFGVDGPELHLLDDLFTAGFQVEARSVDR